MNSDKRLTLTAFAAALVSACVPARTRGADDFTEEEQRNWVFRQQQVFEYFAQLRAVAPRQDFADVYHRAAVKVWTLGHQGSKFPSVYDWPAAVQWRNHQNGVDPLFPPIVNAFGAEFNMIGQPRLRPHTGVDIAAPEGHPVRAVQSGRVDINTRDDNMGLQLRVEHDVGRERATYSHLEGVKVGWGDFVVTGDIIGTVGYTGRLLRSGIPHLHLAIKAKHGGGNRRKSQRWKFKEPNWLNLGYPINWEDN